MTARLLDAACKDVLPLLDAAADGELLDEDRAVVRAHLASCPACRARMDATQGVKAALRAAAAAQEDVPAGLEERVRAEIRAEHTRLTAKNTALFVSALSAAAAVAWMLAPTPSPALTDDEAFAPDEPTLASLVSRHALDVPVDVASPDPARVASFLAPRVGGAVDVPRLDEAGYGLEGARVVDVADGRGAQLVYRGGLGERLTLIVLPDHSGALQKKLLGARAAASLERAGHRLRVWRAENGLHALVGQLPTERLDRVAASLPR